MKSLALTLSLLLAGCAATSANEPSLARRPAEAIDPRLPIASAAPVGTVDPAIATRLGQLIASGNEGARSFDAALGQAEALAGAAGPAQSESWIAAQEALSALEGARAKTTSALAEIDSLAADRVQHGGALGRADQASIEAASNELGAIAERQNATIDRLAARLGR